ncbi:1286_t:CDS:1, partial [Gigaspora rosea]
GHESYLVKALVDTSLYKNIIRKSLVDKLGIKYSDPPKYIKRKMKDAIGIVKSLELSFQFKGKDKLIKSSIDKVLNDFVVCKEPKANLVLGIQWLWLRKAKIDPYGERILFYDRVIPFYMNLSYDLESNISSSDISGENHTPYKTRPEVRNKRKIKILDTECSALQRDNTAYEFLSSSSSGSDSDSSSYNVIVVKAKKHD